MSFVQAVTIAALLGAIGGASAAFCAAQTNTSCGSWLAGMGVDDMDAAVSVFLSLLNATRTRVESVARPRRHPNTGKSHTRARTNLQYSRCATLLLYTIRCIALPHLS